MGGRRRPPGDHQRCRHIGERRQEYSRITGRNDQDAVTHGRCSGGWRRRKPGRTASPSRRRRPFTTSPPRGGQCEPVRISTRIVRSRGPSSWRPNPRWPRACRRSHRCGVWCLGAPRRPDRRPKRFATIPRRALRLALEHALVAEQPEGPATATLRPGSGGRAAADAGTKTRRRETILPARSLDIAFRRS